MMVSDMGRTGWGTSAQARVVPTSRWMESIFWKRDDAPSLAGCVMHQVLYCVLESIHILILAAHI
jgi:hypothetical protein